jgi:multidrug efflux pump subunit AcrA (membrane-fusion protein)
MISSFSLDPLRVIAAHRRGIAGLSLVLAASLLTPPASAASTSPAIPTVVAPASVQAFFSTDLYAKESGYVSQVNADIGDHVKAGQVLAVIDDPELHQQAAKAQAAVAQANAALIMARRQFDALQADLTLARITLKRQEDLFAGKALTDQQIDEARAKTDVSNMDAEVGRAKISAAEADLRSADAEQQRIKALLGYTRLVAPFDGVITRRTLNPGDLVQAATTTHLQPLFTCQKLDQMRVFADVPEASASAISPGTPVQIKLYGANAPSTLQATVTRTAHALDPATRTLRVEIDLPNPAERLLPGTYAQVTLEPESKAIVRKAP